MSTTYCASTAGPFRTALRQAHITFHTAVLALILLAGCGGGREQAAGFATPGTPAAEQAGAAPDGAVPAGVDPALWRQLSAELRRVLEECGTAKRTSAAANGKGSIVCDLGLRISGGQTIFHWYYRQHGDYDLNGIVNAADLVQVGLYYGKHTLSSDWQKAQLADGDYNGQVTVADVAPIGQNFGGRIDGYELQSRADSAQPWVLEVEKPLIPGSPQTGHYPQYTYIGPLMLMGPEYRVVPFTDAGGPRAYGVPSVVFDTKAGLSTRWHTARGNASRDGAAANAGPLDVGSTWELPLTSNAATAFLTEPVVDQYGTIYLGQADNIALNEPTPGRFSAITSAGKLSWTFRTQDGIAMGAATNRLGQIVIADLSGALYCFSPDGKQLWRKQLSGMCVFGSPVLLDSGEVYIVTQVFSGGGFTASTLYKLNSDASVAWSRGAANGCQSSPFLTDAGQICALDTQGNFYCWDADGNAVYDYTLPLKPQSGYFSMGVATRALFLTYAEDSTSFRVNALDNTIGVSNALGTEEPRTMPAITSAGHFILGTQDTGTSALKLNDYLGGAQQWEIGIPGDMMTNIAIDAVDNMYFGTFLQSGGTLAGNGVSCVRNDQSTLWFYPTLNFVPLFCIAASENLVVCLVADGIISGQVKLIGISGS